jgi:hypothetical protein
MTKSLSYNYVKECFEKRGNTLLSKEYKNARTKLEYRCGKCGDICSITFDNYKQGKGCANCGGTKKLTLDFVKQVFEKRGDILLSKVYKNNREKLEYICGNCDEKCSITFDHYKQGQGCAKCGINRMKQKQKLSLEFVKKCFQKRGDNLLLEEYKNSKTKLEYKCGNCGNICSITFDNYQQGKGCANCGGTKKHTLEFVKQVFEKRGDVLLSKEYKDNKKKLEYKCGKCDEKCSIIFNSYNKGSGCPHCSKSRSEKLTREIFERIMGCDFSSIRPHFLKNPKTGYNLELDGYNENLKLAFEYNGIQHYKFHKPFHKNEDNFKKRREHDEFKYKRCIEMGITLICIPYTFNCYNPEELEIFIKDQLFQKEFIFFL